MRIHSTKNLRVCVWHMQNMEYLKSVNRIDPPRDSPEFICTDAKKFSQFIPTNFFNFEKIVLEGICKWIGKMNVFAELSREISNPDDSKDPFLIQTMQIITKFLKYNKAISKQAAIPIENPLILIREYIFCRTKFLHAILR